MYIDLGRDKNQKPVRKNGNFYWEGTTNNSYYLNQFEKPFLRRSQETFAAKARLWSSTGNTEQYCAQVKAALELEEANAVDWLMESGQAEFKKILVSEYVTKMAKLQCEKEAGIVTYLREKQLDKLKLVYQVFQRDPDTFKHIIDKMKPYVEERGTAIVKNEEYLKDPLVFVQKLLDFRRECDDMVYLSFENNHLF